MSSTVSGKDWVSILLPTNKVLAQTSDPVFMRCYYNGSDPDIYSGQAGQCTGVEFCRFAPKLYVFPNIVCCS